MQIQLKQAEIVVALKDYISKKGIDLAGKSVDISFTASRKDAGLMADLSIDDLGIPKYSEENTELPVATVAVVQLVKTPTPEAVLAVAAEEKVDASTDIGLVGNDAEAAPAAEKPKSLFN